jgi:hypothetical protein
MCNCTSGNPAIPGSFVSPTPRNDGGGSIDAKAVYKAVYKAVSAHPRPAAALAFDHFVALLQQALALAILALLLFLDVGAFFVGHGILQAMISRMTMIEAPVPVYSYSIADLRTFMITRRMIVLSSAAGLLAGGGSRPAFAAPPSPNDPLAIVNAIYAHAAKGKGDGGGAFIIESEAAKTRFLSKSLVELWTKADAHTPKGDVGPVDFDPVTNSQEPNVKSFKAVAEKLDADKALVAVTIAGRGAPRPKSVDSTIRYNLVRDNGQWKIDDISGASDGEAWSIRGMLTDSLKN